MNWIETLKPRVGRGARLLDRLSPGWERKVALDDLAMDSCDRCVLGHVYGDYLQGARHLCRDLPGDFLFSTADHGFTLRMDEQAARNYPKPVVDEGFAALADLWRAEVRSRREAGKS